jgi:hypothetical protein
MSDTLKTLKIYFKWHDAPVAIGLSVELYSLKFRFKGEYSVRSGRPVLVRISFGLRIVDEPLLLTQCSVRV